VATTGQNFVLTGGTGSYLNGTTVVTAPFVAALDPVSAQDQVNAAPPTGSGVNTTFPNNSAQPIDRVMFDLGQITVPPGIGTNILTFGRFVGGFAKNGALYITFTGTTAVTIDFTNLSNSVGVTFSQAGDTTLATLNALVLVNISTVISTITVSPGASNPVPFPNALGGTTPTIALVSGTAGAGAIHCQFNPTGATVTSSAKTMTFTPSAAGALVLAYGGA
jgi:hypothetical protein